jgi:hypothetical protein
VNTLVFLVNASVLFLGDFGKSVNLICKEWGLVFPKVLEVIGKINNSSEEM